MAVNASSNLERLMNGMLDFSGKSSAGSFVNLNVFSVLFRFSSKTTFPWHRERMWRWTGYCRPALQ